MKKSLFSLLSLSIAGSLVYGLTAFQKPEESPEIVYCHAMKGQNEMSALAASKDFQNLHLAPKHISYVSAAGDMIKFKTPDGKEANGFLLKSKNKSDKWLMVYQEWWGLNDNIKQQSEKFYNDLKDVNVLAVDMYDGQVATEPAKAGELMKNADQSRLESIMKGALTYAGSNAKIASVGWCFGGMLSLKSAMLEGKQAVGCVMYYGRPEQDVAKLSGLQTDVLGIFGTRDKGITPEMVSKFEENMKTANGKLTVKNYDAEHGFANPSNPIYNKEAADDAYKLAIGYLKGKLNA